MVLARIDADSASPWTWIRRIAILCTVTSALVAVTLWDGAGESHLEADNVALPQADSEIAHSNQHSKMFLIEDNKTLQGPTAAASTDRALLMKVETFDKGASTFDEDEDFYSRMLARKYGSGPFPSSKRSKSGGMMSKGGSKSSKSDGKGDGGSDSKGSKSRSSKGKGDASFDDSRGSKPGKSEGKGNASRSSGSKGSKPGKSKRMGGSGSKRSGPMRSEGKGDASSDSKRMSGPGSKRSRPMRSEGKGDAFISKESMPRKSKRKGAKDKAMGKGGKKKGAKKKGGKRKKKAKRKFEDHRLRRLSQQNHGSESNVLPATTHLTTEELQKITSRFYIYDDPIISQSHVVNKYRRMGKAAFSGSADLDHVKTDMKGEQLILQALQRHPLRTFDPEEADIFVVPTPITELLSYGCQWENCTWYDDAFTALSKQPYFQTLQGHKHVIVVLSWPSFNKRFSAFVPALSRNYARLENVTIAHNYDPFGCYSLRERTEASSVQNDFQKVYQRELPVTNAFSLGLGFNDPFPVHLPTFEKFETSDFFLFYRSRVKSFAYGSTVYRNAPLSASVIEEIPPSSIGNDVPLDEWIHGFTSSKFCLVIRGDTPHSHSFLYAVRAGCIPVVVSDDYPGYATPFKSSMAIEDFGIFIAEQDFLTDPTKQLLTLQYLPEDFIRRKLDNLYVAQTMVVPNHPRSVFVQAFLKEAFEAEKNILPRAPEVEVHEDCAVLSGWEFLYRYPSTLPEASASPSLETEAPNVIVGVTSKSHHFDARHAIRGTWAAESRHGVFFIVAGSWKDIKDEFHLYGDMLWINMIEDDSIDTNKVQLFLQAVNAHVDSYDYVLKANDDSYVWLDDVEHHLAQSKPDYWGGCKTKYTKSTKRMTDNAVVPHRHQRPKYAYGTAYVLSREFNECAAQSIASIGLMSNEEDVATGLLAELCGVSCNDDGLDWWKTPKENKRGLKFIDGHKKTSEEMLYKHWYVLWKRGGWDA